MLVLLWGLSVRQWGAPTVWRTLGVPVMVPNFADTRIITAGAESAAVGLDPLIISNPTDPWHRPLNYPRIWQSLFVLGIDQRHTVILATVFISLFFLGVIMLMNKVNAMAVGLQLFCIASPAVCLGLERGNNDLVVFFLISCAVLAMQVRPAFSAILIWFGFVLKLYPIAALNVFSDLTWKRQLKLLAATTLCSAVYFLLKREEIRIVWESTPKSFSWSYGSQLLPLYVVARFGGDKSLVSILGPPLALVVALVSAWLGHSRPVASQAEPVHLAAFRAGSAVFILSFVLRASFSYRLIFLLMTVPSLAAWVRSSEHTLKIAAAIATVALLITLWTDGLQLFLFDLMIPQGRWIGFVITQLSAWILLGALTYINAASLPATGIVSLFRRPKAGPVS